MLVGVQLPVAAPAQELAIHPDELAGADLVHAPVDGVPGGLDEGDQLAQPVGVDRGRPGERIGEDRLGLGAEQHARRGRVVVQRLDTHPVADEQQFLTAGVPDREGEHAVQPVGDVLAPFEVGPQQDLGVASGSGSCDRGRPARRATRRSCRSRRCSDRTASGSPSSATTIGWRPPSMSMTASRRWPIATCGASQTPASSGPRQAMVSIMARATSRAAASSSKLPVKSTVPAMPHMGRASCRRRQDGTTQVFRPCNQMCRTGYAPSRGSRIRRRARRRGVHPDVPVVLGHDDPPRDVQPQAGALTDVLRREEGLEVSEAGRPRGYRDRCRRSRRPRCPTRVGSARSASPSPPWPRRRCRRCSSTPG